MASLGKGLKSRSKDFKLSLLVIINWKIRNVGYHKWKNEAKLIKRKPISVICIQRKKYGYK